MKNQVKLFDRILVLVEECEALYGLRIVHHGKVSIRTLKRQRKNCIGSVRKKGLFSSMEPDATFMRMKEDAMQNGQLKPAYNLQHGVDSEYITWLDLSSRPTDTGTLIPFLKDMKEHLPFQFQEIVADAGYESECSVLTFTSCRRINRRY